MKFLEELTQIKDADTEQWYVLQYDRRVCMQLILPCTHACRCADVALSLRPLSNFLVFGL